MMPETILGWVLCLGAALVVFGIYLWIKVARVWPLEASPDMSDEELGEAVDAWARSLQEAGRFSGVILLVRGGKVVVASGYGSMDHMRDRPLTENSSMRLASISKQFTAAAILKLVETDRLASLDDAVAKYLEGFPYAEVTVRHLLNQTSGIPDKYMALAKGRGRGAGVLTNAEAFELLCADAPPQTEPAGTQFEYSNTNYVLLAHLLETVTGESLEEYLGREILMPLGMVNTRIWNKVSTEPPGEHMTGGFNVYQKEPGRGEFKTGVLDGVSGDGAVHSSASDMAIWNRFWIDGAGVLSPESVAAAQTAPELAGEETTDYGFGWCVKEGDRVWHNGSWLAARTMFIRGRDGQDALFLANNDGGVALGPMTRYLERLIPAG